MSLVSLIATLIITSSMAYFVLLMWSGIKEIRRTGTRLDHLGSTSYGTGPADAATDLAVYFLVPCLNEAEVIGTTVAGLTINPGTTTVVIDDGSDDDTAAIALAAGGARVEVVRRDPPQARQGKGAALNAGLARVREMAATLGQDPDRVVVCVMDADGRLSAGALQHVLPLFDRPGVGGVQLQVRIRNRTSFLTRFQDFEFWAASSVTQIGRSATGTVSLGGNAQFSRLSALDSVGERPWTASLTEDLDLAITLAVRGWELTTTPFASVEQQAVETVPLLLRQRTRWYQGHMMTIRRVPEIWRSPHLSHVAALELSFYCLSPWVLTLPWSILFHVCLADLMLNASALLAFAPTPVTMALVILAWYVLAFAPAVFNGWLYWRRDHKVGLLRGLTMGNYMVLTNYLSFACAWKALFRVVRGETAWAKTARTREEPAPARQQAPVPATEMPVS